MLSMWKWYPPCVGRPVMKAIGKRTILGWLLSLMVWLALVECGMNTAELGERTDCYGVLDDSVKPFLVTRLPLAGVGVGEWAPVIDPGHTKYSHVRRRHTYRKYRGSPPPLWLQRLLYRTLLTVLYIKRAFTHAVQCTRVLLQFTVSCVRVIPTLLRARMLVSTTALCAKTLPSLLPGRDLRKVRVRVSEISTRPQQQLCLGTHTKLVLILLLCLVMCGCGLVCHLAGYDVGVIEMLLMMSGDIEPNPGPVMLRLRAVLTELLPASASWYNIGLALDMDEGTLDAMKVGTYKDPRDCLREMLKEWLRTSDPDPSWEGLIAALKDPIVGQGTLARQLETKHCAQEPPPAGTQQVKVVQSDPITQQEQPPPGADPMAAQQQCDSGVPSPKRPKLQQRSPPSGQESTSESRDSPSLGITKADMLEPYAEYLRETYDIQTPEFILQWPPLPTTKVFNLAMVSKPPVERCSPNEELVSLMLREGVGRVMAMNAHTTVKLEKLFTLDNQKRKVVLIEGAPGAGKSTLAWHICQKWKARELFHQEFKVVIYVQLRDPEVQSATSVSDFIPSHPEIKTEDAMAELKRSLGKGILFVLDGWDEYGPGLQPGSLLHKLICNPQKLNLHHSTLLITSRPIASRELLHYAASRVEIMGFLPHEVHRYFEEVIKDPSATQMLQDQLKESPVIEASCYLPLNAAIVAHLFIELNHTLPRTLHGVFSAVVCGCIRRYLTKQGKDEDVPSLDELPSSVQDDFQSVCTLAYEGSMKNKVTFSSQDLRSYGLSADRGVLDLVQVLQSFAGCKSKLCHFLHLSVQELLTALKISKLPPPEQVQVFQEMFNKPRFEVVFRFYAAFTKLQVEGIRDIVARIARTARSQSSLLNLMHCLYEAQDLSLCCFVASQLNGELDLADTALNPLDCLSVGYFLTCACTSGEFQADLRNCPVRCHNVRFLAKGLLLGPYVHGKLSLSLGNNNHLLGEGARYLSVIISRSSIISKLSLSWNWIQQGEDGFKHLLEALKTNTSIVYLNLGTTKLDITESNGPALVEMLKVNQTLQVLDLSNNFISDQGLEYLGEGLKENRGIKSLNLVSIRQVTEPGLKRFVLCLRENDHLTELTLDCIRGLLPSPFILLIFGPAAFLESFIVHQEEAEVNRQRQQKGLQHLVISHPSFQGFSAVISELSFQNYSGSDDL